MTASFTLDKTLHAAAPAADLWAYVTDWAKHTEWFPLSKTEAVGGEARGVGGQLKAWSGIGPVGFWDPMTITAWEERDNGSGHFSVAHTGRIVRGDAAVTVEALSESDSSLRWVEHLQFGRVGAIGWRLSGPLLDRALDRALRKLVAKVEE